MNLSELIAKYGDDRVQFQSLDQCTEALNMNKGITKITFGTEQPIGLDGTQKLGLVVWLDRDAIRDGNFSLPPLREKWWQFWRPAENNEFQKSLLPYQNEVRP